MITSPYSIYINKRPLRVAFLIDDTPQSFTRLDDVLAYSRDRWGGRYNPIIITNGKTLTEPWWALLEALDPDVVKAVISLNDELFSALDRRICPYLIEKRSNAEEHDNRVHIYDTGLSILPTPAYVRAIGWPGQDSTLVLFETHWQKTDPLLKRFIEWNFGGYSPRVRAVAEAMTGVSAEVYPLTDIASIVPPLTELSNSFKPHVYPIQLCSLPDYALPDVEYDRFGETFHVIVGATPADVAYFWNRPASVPRWCRSHLKQLWLPEEFAANATFVPALTSWLQRQADPNGNWQGSIRFVSLSVGQTQLEELIEPITRNLKMRRSIEALGSISAPVFTEGSPGPRRAGNIDLYRGSATTERLTLREPDLFQGPLRGQHWMADVYTEFHPERYPTISGRQLWWQLPRFNPLAWHMFKRPSRILRSRFPSVLMKEGEPVLDLTLADDLSVFASLIVGEGRPYYTFDARSGEPAPCFGRKPFLDVRRSEKGRYLSGLLDLFGGLHPATGTLEERYWRGMFDVLSGRMRTKEEGLLERVRNLLTKRLRANPADFYKDDKSMTWLTRQVINLARTLPAAFREVDFRTFEDAARSEIADFNATRAGGQAWEYSREDLLTALSELIEKRVLLTGIRARCTSCGYRDWHHIDDAKQMLACGGCNASFPMSPEPSWYYRLNNLVRAACGDHGLVPVVLVLGQLLMDARSAFLFAPCLDLFDKDGDGPIGDLDIAVIIDGAFVIGEVKQSQGLFDAETFRKMEDVASRLLPDRLLFSSMDREPSTFVKDQIDQLAKRLSSRTVAVEWYPIQAYKFEASPVR